LVHINEVRPIYLKFYHTKRAIVLNIGMTLSTMIFAKT
jgi:hypothetical protein